jgi:hypothetical protein
MKPKPFSMRAGLAENTFVYIFNYAGDETSFDTDKTAYIAELEKHLMINNTLSFPQYGIGVTGSTDLTVTQPSSDTIITEGTVTTGLNITYPIVIYKGVAVPYSAVETAYDPATGIIELTGTDYTTDSDDYVIHYSDHLLGDLVSIDAPNVGLPLESNSFNAVGHDDPVLKVTKRGDADASGSLSVIEHMTSLMESGGTTPLNNPGEDLLTRIYGSEWTQGSNGIYDSPATWNTLKAPTNPFGVAILVWTGQPLTGGSIAGEVWGNLHFIYHCRLTNISAPQNITGDSTDPILRNIEFECQFPDSNQQITIYCAA